VLNAKTLYISLAAAALVALANWAVADELAKPDGDVILEVRGAIANTNGDGVARFDRPMLEALGVAEITTTTAWHDGDVVFAGVPLAALLDAVGAEGETLIATAANDYSVELDIGEMRENEALMAMRENGEIMRLRDHGPIWIVFDREAYPDYRDEAHNYKWIWQLTTLEIR
jgi:hypothetical protein